MGTDPVNDAFEGHHEPITMHNADPVRQTSHTETTKGGDPPKLIRIWSRDWDTRLTGARLQWHNRRINENFATILHAAWYRRLRVLWEWRLTTDSDHAGNAEVQKKQHSQLAQMQQ